MIGALCIVNEWLLAKMVFKEMIFNGFEVDDLSYFAMFQCFCRYGYVDEADLMLRTLVERKFDIDVSVYGKFLYALCESVKFREANKLFRKLIKWDSFVGSKEFVMFEGGEKSNISVELCGCCYISDGF